MSELPFVGQWIDKLMLDSDCLLSARESITWSWFRYYIYNVLSFEKKTPDRLVHRGCKLSTCLRISTSLGSVSYISANVVNVVIRRQFQTIGNVGKAFGSICNVRQTFASWAFVLQTRYINVRRFPFLANVLPLLPMFRISYQYLKKNVASTCQWCWTLPDSLPMFTKAYQCLQDS